MIEKALQAQNRGRKPYDTLDELYLALQRIGLRPSDIVNQIRAEGKKINHLSQLSDFEMRKLIHDAKKYEA